MRLLKEKSVSGSAFSRVSHFVVVIITAMMIIMPSAQAGVILQASNAWTDGAPYSLPVENIINQSGLSSPYVSGVDDFDTYLSSNTSYWPNGPAADLGDTSGALDNFYFDLGGIFNVDAIAIWNQAGTASLKDFDILASADASFSTTTLLGSYSIDNGPAVNPGSVFHFSALDVRYLAIDVTANYGFSLATRINEVAFRQADPVSIPEPSSIALILLGLIAILWARKRKAHH